MPHLLTTESKRVPETSETRRATVAAVVTVVLWASSFVAIRDIADSISPAPMALLRLAVAAAALSVMVGLTRRRRLGMPSSRRSVVLLLCYGVLWLGAYTVALNTAEHHVDAGTAAMLVNVAPLLVAFGAGVFLREGFPRPLVLGSLVAFGGVSVIATGSSGERDAVGVALCLLAAVLYAVGVLVQKVLLRDVDALVATWLGCVIATVALLPWLPPLIAQVRDAPAGAVVATVYLGLFPTAIGFSTWAYALRRMPAGRLTASTYAVPAVSVGLSWVLLAEVPGAAALAGGVICLVGVAISRRRVRARRPHS